MLAIRLPVAIDSLEALANMTAWQRLEPPALLVWSLRGSHSVLSGMPPGAYRIIASIEEDEVGILVVRIGKRGDVYQV